MFVLDRENGMAQTSPSNRGLALRLVAPVSDRSMADVSGDVSRIRSEDGVSAGSLG